jgi:hypothetical protein
MERKAAKVNISFSKKMAIVTAQEMTVMLVLTQTQEAKVNYTRSTRRALQFHTMVVVPAVGIKPILNVRAKEASLLVSTASKSKTALTL